jgi:hypothetical protein
MKPIFTIAAVLAAFSAAAQVNEEESLETSLLGREKQMRLDLDKPNEITVGPFAYSGIAIQIVKTDSLAQLFNPAASTKYGFGEDNLVRDPIDNRPSGLKIFSIQF